MCKRLEYVCIQTQDHMAGRVPQVDVVHDRRHNLATRINPINISIYRYQLIYTNRYIYMHIYIYKYTYIYIQVFVYMSGLPSVNGSPQ